MDFQEKRNIPNPREKSNPISLLMFWWMNPIFRKGFKSNLEADDLYNCLKEDQAGDLGPRLSDAWDAQRAKAKLKNGKPKLYKALLSVFIGSYIPLLLGVIIDECVIRVAQPLYLKYLIYSFAEKDPDRTWQFIYAAGVCVTTLLHTLVMHPTFFTTQHLGMRARVACSSLIYRKTLRLSKAAQEKATVGHLINLLSNDVSRFDLNLMFLSYILVGPLQMCIFTYFLYEEVGVAIFAGVGFIVLLIPVQYVIGRLFTVFRAQIAQKTDERGKIMNEIIIAMRVIKMYAWEKPFSTMINHLRKLEVQILRKAAGTRSVYVSLYIASAKVVTYFVFLVYILHTGNTLTADVVFFTITVFNVVRQVMVSYIPTAAAALGELVVSIDRIEAFLLLEDKDVNSNNLEILSTKPASEPDKRPEASVVFKNATAKWNADKIALNNLNADLRGDRLVMVVGSVGAGKTSLLHALLAELPFQSGKCTITGRTAYACQEPWIFGGNVRQNILFGREYNEAHYDEIVEVCALKDDFKQLPHGDMTTVGERGVSLSGGQKARINLARALYQEADIYLMDDPLSAVDTRVSRHIFEKCVKTYLTGYLRILVTHQLQYLPQADHIIVFDNGEITAQGSYAELMAKNIDFLTLMTSDSGEDEKRKASVIAVEAPKEPKAKEHEKQKIVSEKMVGGSVTYTTYWEYFKAGNSRIGLFFLAFNLVVNQILYTVADWFLSYWTKAENDYKETKDEDAYWGENTYLYIYTGLTVAIFLVTQFRAFHYFMYSMAISINIHNRMFASLVRAPTKFFDDNPSGRVMNRFTKDLGSMDEFLPHAFFDAVSIFFLMFGMMVLVIVANYYIIVPTVLLVAALFLLRRFYIKTARDVKRVEAICRSPVFTHLAASVQGLTTIRSSGSQTILMKQFDGHQDIHTSAWFMFISANRWFGIWVEMVSVTFLSLVTYSFLLLASSDAGGDVGLAISSALALTGTFQYGMRQSAETENLMTSVERALEYSNLESEAPLDSKPDKKPPSDWPKSGEIQFQNMYLAYEEKDVLKGLTFDIKAMEKIGIVGRTGAGKSSIVAALFRMSEPRGDIFIDGVRINDIGLHDLRRNISIIPQDPVLFSGTMRYNLDPFAQFKDDELWKVLEEVELNKDVTALDLEVSGGGSNFSVGQRQLVCLARAILRKNRIIVMDEATANVDPKTDNFIQKTIRKEFAECSIITIAHRLHSVMDCDRILVLDNGYLKEYGHPHVLLQNREGLLSVMVSHTGKASAEVLRRVAAETHSGRRESFAPSTVNFIRKSIPSEELENSVEPKEN